MRIFDWLHETYGIKTIVGMYNPTVVQAATLGKAVNAALSSLF